MKRERTGTLFYVFHLKTMSSTGHNGHNRHNNGADLELTCLSLFEWSINRIAPTINYTYYSVARVTTAGIQLCKGVFSM